MVMNFPEINRELLALKNQKNIEGMARFGIETSGALGIPIPVLRAMAKKIGKNHALAEKLWGSLFHEAKILASLIDDPLLVTSSQMERWVLDFNSWDICDQVCGNLFDRTVFAKEKAVQWAKRPEEFVKRAGFVLMAGLAVHDKKASDQDFMPFFELIVSESTDERNFVRKAVNWALRQIGKRNPRLLEIALSYARIMEKDSSTSARWIAKDAIRELESRKRNPRKKSDSPLNHAVSEIPQKRQALKEFQTIPGVGKSIAEDLWNLGFRSLSDIKGQDPLQMYEKACLAAGVSIDRCLLYVFRCAVYFVSNKSHDPRLLQWWNWKD